MVAAVIQKGGRGRRGRRQMSEINVTPFVDVMLVLLIIFMVAAPLLTVGVPVELPKTAAAPLPTEQEEPLTLALTSDGRVLLQSQEVSLDRLIPLLRAIAAERQDDKVFLRADGAVPYALVAQVMGALSTGGFTRIGLVTDPGGPTFDGTASATPGNTPGTTPGTAPDTAPDTAPETAPATTLRQGPGARPQNRPDATPGTPAGPIPLPGTAPEN